MREKEGNVLIKLVKHGKISLGSSILLLRVCYNYILLVLVLIRILVCLILVWFDFCLYTLNTDKPVPSICSYIY